MHFLINNILICNKVTLHYANLEMDPAHQNRSVRLVLNIHYKLLFFLQLTPLIHFFNDAKLVMYSFTFDLNFSGLLIEREAASPFKGSEGLG